MAVIYKATNKVNGKSYIGFATDFNKRQINHKFCSQNNKDNSYFHNAIKKNGWDNFEWNILREDATLEDEKHFIKECDTFWENGKGYNLTLGGEGMTGYSHSVETRQKMSKSQMGRTHSEESRKKISESKIGKPISEEHKGKVSQANKGRVYSDEYKRKMSETKKGVIFSDDHRRNLSEALKGHKHSPETRKKLSEARQKRIITDETKRKLSEATKNHWAKRKMNEVLHDLS